MNTDERINAELCLVRLVFSKNRQKGGATSRRAKKAAMRIVQDMIYSDNHEVRGKIFTFFEEILTKCKLYEQEFHYAMFVLEHYAFRKAKMSNKPSRYALINNSFGQNCIEAFIATNDTWYENNDFASIILPKYLQFNRNINIVAKMVTVKRTSFNAPEIAIGLNALNQLIRTCTHPTELTELKLLVEHCLAKYSVREKERMREKESIIGLLRKLIFIHGEKEYVKELLESTHCSLHIGNIDGSEKHPRLAAQNN